MVVLVVRWCISAPHVWWYHILHDEVNQTLLKVGSCPLLGGGQDCYIYSERLTGGGRGVRGGGRAIRAKTEGEDGYLDFGSDRHLINTKPHKDTAHWGQEKAEEWGW